MILPTLTAEAFSHLRVDADRLKSDFDELAQIGATPEGGVTRLALSPEDLRARAWYAERIEAAGLLVKDDDAGNLSAVLPSADLNAQTLLIGSHLDSVPNGGRFDGSVGVLSALECLRLLRERDVRLPVTLEAISFTDDEGCWRSLFGSRALAGMLSEDDIFDLQGDNAPFRAALSRAGIDPRAVYRAERAHNRLAGYVELHIEQGERLERTGVNIGVVTDIVGRTTYEIVFFGQAGHSGTTDMYHRRDALRGAAQFIVRAHEQVRARYGDGVFNCGDIEVKPGKFNVIPSEARLIVECRHAREKLMAEMEMLIVQIARESAASNGLTVESKPVAHMPVAPMSSQVIRAVEQACSLLGLSTMPLISYSGHDAQIISRIAPSAMIFIPSVRGISHRPEEYTHWSDVVNGANVLLQTVLKLALSDRID